MTHREMMEEAAKQGITFDAEPGDLGYAKSADAEVNTLEAFMKRRKIRRHPVVIKVSSRA